MLTSGTFFYTLKKLALSPYTSYMRYRERESTGFIKSALELHYYRPAFYRFIQAKIEQPDILHAHSLGPDSIVLDVGAYTGQWAEKILQSYQCRVYAFEPNPQTFVQLAEKSKQFPGLETLNYGLGGESMTAEITLRGLGSTVFDSREVDRSSAREQATILSVDEAWDSLALDRVKLMKINIEGAEFDLLERMIESELLDKVDCFMIQFHEWHPGAHLRRRRIRRVLARTHQLDWDYHFVWEKWTRR